MPNNQMGQSVKRVMVSQMPQMQPNGQLMPGQPMQNAPQMIQQRPLFLKKKTKLKDKVIPQKIRELVPESQAYMDLLAFEQKLDSTIMRKRLDIQEALKRYSTEFAERKAQKKN
jgi:SWI/SNF-related matrix-associated actin-dependent regulator of chromatin subfamily D